MKIFLLLVLAVVSTHQACDKFDLGDQSVNIANDGNLCPSECGVFTNGVISSPSSICSEIGKNILQKPGANTADAMIATMLCIGMVHPHSCGLGGGHLSTVVDTYNGNQPGVKASTVMGREVAPKVAREDFFDPAYGRSSTLGGTAIGTMGEVAGLRMLFDATRNKHPSYPGLTWPELFDDTIALGENGFDVDEALAVAALRKNETMFSDPCFKAVFVKNGALLVEGDEMKRQNYANTLKRVKADAGDFYFGTLADDVVNEVQGAGGVIDQYDMRNYRPRWEDALEATLKDGTKIYGPQPPSSAAVVMHILKVMDEFNMSPSDVATQADRERTAHRLIESLKFGFGTRSFLADSVFASHGQTKKDYEKLMVDLLDDAFAAGRRALIDDTSALPFPDYDSYWSQTLNTGTTHTSGCGPDGVCLGISATINFHYGAKVCGPVTGIFYNNEMDDFGKPWKPDFFGLAASEHNFIEKPNPNGQVYFRAKSPMSSMSPIVVVKPSGDTIAVGASGGPRIITTITQILLNQLFLGRTEEEAIDEARVHHQLLPRRLQYEWEATPMISSLQAKQDAVLPQPDEANVVLLLKGPNSEFSVAQTAGYRSGSGYWGCSDRRRGGKPDGF